MERPALDEWLKRSESILNEMATVEGAIVQAVHKEIMTPEEGLECLTAFAEQVNYISET